MADYITINKEIYKGQLLEYNEDEELWYWGTLSYRWRSEAEAMIDKANPEAKTVIYKIYPVENTKARLVTHAPIYVQNDGNLANLIIDHWESKGWLVHITIERE